MASRLSVSVGGELETTGVTTSKDQVGNSPTMTECGESSTLSSTVSATSNRSTGEHLDGAQENETKRQDGSEAAEEHSSPLEPKSYFGPSPSTTKPVLSQSVSFRGPSVNDEDGIHSVVAKKNPMQWGSWIFEITFFLLSLGFFLGKSSSPLSTDSSNYKFVLESSHHCGSEVIRPAISSHSSA